MESVKARSGFTVVEVMVASLVLGIVLTAVTTSFLTAQRMLSTAMAEAELSLATRQLRNKLLFQASPPINGHCYEGLLSATNLSENELSSGVIRMTGGTVGATLSDVGAQSIRLIPWTVDGHAILINDHTPDKDRYVNWLWPARMGLAENDFGKIVDWAPYQATHNLTRLYIDLTLQADVRTPTGRPITRKERVMIPLMGKIQPMRDKNTGGKETY